MARLRVTVRNSTSIIVKIEEGHERVFRVVENSMLGPNGTFKLKIDQIVTHKEYRLIRVSDNEELERKYTRDNIISFTKTAGFKEMVVKMKEGSDPPEYYWEPSYDTD